MAVSISVPLAADDANLEHPYIDTELTTNDFSEASKRILNRVYNQVLADNVTLAGGRRVDTPSLLFEKLLELVAAAE